MFFGLLMVPLQKGTNHMSLKWFHLLATSGKCRTFAASIIGTTSILTQQELNKKQKIKTQIQ